MDNELEKNEAVPETAEAPAAETPVESAAPAAEAPAAPEATPAE